MSLHLCRAAAVVAALAVLCPGTRALRAQETPAGIPPDVVERVVDFYNRDGTVHLSGEATLAAGSVYSAWGGKAYLLMTGMGLVAIAFAVLLSRRWTGARVIHGAQEEQVDTI